MTAKMMRLLKSAISMCAVLPAGAHAAAIKCTTANLLGPKFTAEITYEKSVPLAPTKITFRPCPLGTRCDNFIFDENVQIVSDRARWPLGVYLGRRGPTNISVHIYASPAPSVPDYQAVLVAFVQDGELVYKLNCRTP